MKVAASVSGVCARSAVDALTGAGNESQLIHKIFSGIEVTYDSQAHMGMARS